MTTVYYHPLDPDCPALAEVRKFRDHPNVRIGKMVQAEFDNQHRLICERCQRYGAANIQTRDE